MSLTNYQELERIQARISENALAEIEASVKEIITRVKQEGNKALISYSKKFANCEWTEQNPGPKISVSLSPK